MRETEHEGQRIDDEFYGNPYKNMKKRDSADEFYDDHKHAMSAHVRKAERLY